MYKIVFPRHQVRKSKHFPTISNSVTHLPILPCRYCRIECQYHVLSSEHRCRHFECWRFCIKQHVLECFIMFYYWLMMFYVFYKCFMDMMRNNVLQCLVSCATIGIGTCTPQSATGVTLFLLDNFQRGKARVKFKLIFKIENWKAKLLIIIRGCPVPTGGN